MKSVRACGRRHELDVQTLVWTRGAAFPISMLSGRMKCPSCQTSEVVVTLSLPGSVLAAAAKAGSSGPYHPQGAWPLQIKVRCSCRKVESGSPYSEALDWAVTARDFAAIGVGTSDAGRSLDNLGRAV